MITVDELMTAEPYTLRETDTLRTARQLMTEKHIRHIPITDDNNRLFGLITQRDVLQAADSDNETRLEQIMIQDVSVIAGTDSARSAAIHLQQHKYGCLPVVGDDNQVVGIITDSDFVGVAINLLEQVEIAEDQDDSTLEPDTMDDVDMPVLDEDF